MCHINFIATQNLYNPIIPQSARSNVKQSQSTTIYKKLIIYTIQIGQNYKSKPFSNPPEYTQKIQSFRIGRIQ